MHIFPNIFNCGHYKISNYDHLEGGNLKNMLIYVYPVWVRLSIEFVWLSSIYLQCTASSFPCLNLVMFTLRKKYWKALNWIRFSPYSSFLLKLQNYLWCISPFSGFWCFSSTWINPLCPLTQKRKITSFLLPSFNCDASSIDHVKTVVSTFVKGCIM